MKDNPLISIVIPTFNRAPALKEALDTIRKQIFEEFEVIVVDNGPSNDETAEIVTALAAEDTRFIYLPLGPEGCVVSRNTGFRRCRAPLLFTIDDDVELINPNTLGYIVACFKNNPLLGVLGLSEYYPGGKGKGAAVIRDAPNAWRWTWRDTTLYTPGKINRWGFIGTKLYHLPFGHLHEVDHVRSSAMAIRGTAYESVGGFFELYTAMGYGYRYETELCVRVKRHGYKVVFSARDPQVYHKAAERPRGWTREGLEKDYLLYTNRNNTLFFLRNYWDRWTSWVFLLWDFLVGNTSQPGLLRFALYQSAPWWKIKAALRGKLWGWKMYRQFRG